MRITFAPLCDYTAVISEINDAQMCQRFRVVFLNAKLKSGGKIVDRPPPDYDDVKSLLLISNRFGNKSPLNEGVIML